MNEIEQIIDLISQQTKILLQNHWQDINEFRNGQESIKVSFSHDISYQQQKKIVGSAISFHKTIKDMITQEIDTDQMNLDLSAGAAAVAIVTNKKRRGRPPGTGKKNVLETTLKTWPKPDPVKGDAA